eukprot:g2310.t1
MLLEALEKVTKRNPAIYVARGTARALQRKLEEAIEDFSTSIEIMPMYPESWKRRSQARSALGQNEQALKDLDRAIELSGDSLFKAECIFEQGMIYHKLKNYKKAVGVLQKSLGLNPKSAQAMNMLGLCLVSLGDIKEGLEAYEKTIKLDRVHKDVYFNKCQTLKEVGRVKEAEDVYKEGRQIEKELGRVRYLGINRVMASMYQGMGQHEKAIPYLDEVVDSKEDRQKLECLFLRAACYHALGWHDDASEDYTQCMQFEKYLEKDDPIERRQFVILAFYQKEMCLFLHHNLDTPINEFCIDKELSPLFKELWCKKMSPTSELISQYTFQRPTQGYLPPRVDAPDQMELTRLIKAAEDLGYLLQNSHQGFLPNRRQQLSAGCAAIELAQSILDDLESRRCSSHLMVESCGSSGTKTGSKNHPFHWRDAMDILVKWRQLSEPNDQVVWVDLLTQEEFESGFGSHTPIFSGQTKCVRYYMNFDRAFNKQKEVLLSTRKAYNSKNEEIKISASDQEILKASTTGEMYSIIGQDSWVIVPIRSLAQPSEIMEGTRLTLVKMPDQFNGFEFSIRTPVTPPRWKQFEKDLYLAWENFMTAMEQGDKIKIAKCILTFVYYWYNFMPLARGTAACGYTTILAMFWAADMPVLVSIPQDYQVDWEAILEPHPDVFYEALCQWMVPEDARPDVFEGQTKKGSRDVGVDFPPIKSLPRVKELLNTTRKRLYALNEMNAKNLYQ